MQNHFEIKLKDIQMYSYIEKWAESTTRSSVNMRSSIHAKIKDVQDFLQFASKPLEKITDSDVEQWCTKLLERNGLKIATVTSKLSKVRSFFNWAIGQAELNLKYNPAALVRPAIQPASNEIEKIRESTETLKRNIKQKADRGDLSAKRDYAFLLLYLATPLSRSDVIGMRRENITITADGIVISSLPFSDERNPIIELNVADKLLGHALEHYLSSTGRLNRVGPSDALWLRHDPYKHTDSPPSSQAFSKAMAGYMRLSRIDKLNLKQLRIAYRQH